PLKTGLRRWARDLQGSRDDRRGYRRLPCRQASTRRAEFATSAKLIEAENEKFSAILMPPRTAPVGFAKFLNSPLPHNVTCLPRNCAGIATISQRGHAPLAPPVRPLAPATPP